MGLSWRSFQTCSKQCYPTNNYIHIKKTLAPYLRKCSFHKNGKKKVLENLLRNTINSTLIQLPPFVPNPVKKHSKNNGYLKDKFSTNPPWVSTATFNDQIRFKIKNLHQLRINSFSSLRTLEPVPQQKNVVDYRRLIIGKERTERSRQSLI